MVFGVHRETAKLNPSCLLPCLQGGLSTPASTARVSTMARHMPGCRGKVMGELTCNGNFLAGVHSLAARLAALNLRLAGIFCSDGECCSGAMVVPCQFGGCMRQMCFQVWEAVGSNVSHCTACAPHRGFPSYDGTQSSFFLVPPPCTYLDFAMRCKSGPALAVPGYVAVSRKVS